ncbi:hypothetical protein SAMN04487851_1143 [Prevotella sp. tc2-28]|nr:hypothetical protein SAMN04487851_1143 [Prevotella sp. tc2-28]
MTKIWEVWQMVSEMPNVKKQGKYSAKETALALGIDPKTLWRHTQLNHIHCERRKCNGRPVYLGEEIIRYWGAMY